MALLSSELIRSFPRYGGRHGIFITAGPVAYLSDPGAASAGYIVRLYRHCHIAAAPVGCRVFCDLSNAGRRIIFVQAELFRFRIPRKVLCLYDNLIRTVVCDHTVFCTDSQDFAVFSG